MNNEKKPRFPVATSVVENHQFIEVSSEISILLSCFYGIPASQSSFKQLFTSYVDALSTSGAYNTAHASQTNPTNGWLVFHKLKCDPETGFARAFKGISLNARDAASREK